MTAGKGFLALAALIFGKWRVWPALFACLLFAFTDALQIRLQGVALPGVGVVPIQAVQALPYVLTVLLLAGHGHVAPALGVPQHLPPTFKAKTVLLLASQGDAAIESIAKFDLVWPTGPIPPRDYCAEFKATRKP